MTTTERIPGFCALCRSRCGCISVVEQGRLVAVEPDPVHPTGQHLCVKGRAAPELVYAPDRLLHPMRRTRPRSDPDPGWERIGWNEALDWTAERMRAVADRHGPEAVAFGVTTPAGTAISDGFPWINRLIRAFGSPNMVWGEELCAWHRDYATAYTFGTDIGTPDFDRTGCLLLWGHNPSATYLAQATAVAEARARGVALVVIDPRRAGPAAQADQWLRVRPGTDGALALGLAGVMIAEGWYDRDFVRDWSNGALLVREDTGQLLTAADLSPDGNPAHHVAWDRGAARPLAYDPAAGRFVDRVVEPMLAGGVTCVARSGPVECRTAFERYAALCREYPPARVDAITGVPAAQIVETARLLWARRPVSYFHWTGLEQHTNASQTVRAVSLLYALTGCFDAPGGNVRPARPPINDLGPLALLSDKQRAKAIGLAERPLGPARLGWVTAGDLYRAILHGTPYAVRGMVGFGANLLLSQPGVGVARAALSRLDFLVYADLFLTPTAALADVVLPVSSAWEREGLRVGFGPTQHGEAFVQLRRRVVEPQGEARSDTWIVCELARRLGLGKTFFDGDEDAGHRVALEPTGVTLEQLRENPGGVRVPTAPAFKRYTAPGPEGRPAGFATPSRRVEIFSAQLLEHGQNPLPDYVEPAASPVSRPDLAARFPLRLTTAKVVQFCHSQHRNLPRLRRHSPDPLVEIHPDAAATRAIEAESWVLVETPHATMRARARFNNSLEPDVVCAQFGWWQACEPLDLPGYDVDGPAGANYNSLIDPDATDPISGTVALRSYLCEVRRGEP
ncbi:MAG TPA: molybdopterin-dependent oxidoreductase [Candidatus Dormibacteraeota bacterium]|nr:molybdopterin-dependent oxidoreductase [Candidatus Dormibacteraeota bacterium]